MTEWEIQRKGRDEEREYAWKEIEHGESHASSCS